MPLIPKTHLARALQWCVWSRPLAGLGNRHSGKPGHQQRGHGRFEEALCVPESWRILPILPAHPWSFRTKQVPRGDLLGTRKRAFTPARMSRPPLSLKPAPQSRRFSEINRHLTAYSCSGADVSAAKPAIRSPGGEFGNAGHTSVAPICIFFVHIVTCSPKLTVARYGTFSNPIIAMNPNATCDSVIRP